MNMKGIKKIHAATKYFGNLENSNFLIYFSLILKNNN